MNKIRPLNLPFVEDDRGYFQKLFTSDHPDLSDFSIKQVNKVGTLKKGTLRGLHFQAGSFAEAKIFKVLHGSLLLAAFCVDKKCDNFKKSYEYTLTPQSASVYIPKGYATGYLVLKDQTEVIYFSDNVYNPEAEKGIKWNDPILKIAWKITDPILSEKDKAWPEFNVT